jgi:beta-glucanase (GH16 family)
MSMMKHPQNKGCQNSRLAKLCCKLSRAAANLVLIAGLISAKQAFAASTQWNIVWNDEFTQADGSSPDSTKWGFDIGNGSGGWGNLQLEYDTARTNNACIVGGQLVIEADQESYGGKNYTSARMLTKGKWSWAYGRMEARIKIPKGQGIWPAFWMLGTNFDSVGWPTCGEIDIMENIGKTNDQRKAHGTIHGPQSGGDYNGGAGVGGTYMLPAGAVLADDFHIYAVEWTTNQIKWFVDTHQYFTATPASLPSGATWVFTQPQFFILNVAVGGRWPGNPDGTTVFPQQMLVDYVRVYNQTAPLAISVEPQPDGSSALSWPTNIVCHLQIQTNALTGTWVDVSNPTNPFVISPDPNNVCVFYRLQSP